MLSTKSTIAALVLLFSASSAFAAITKPGAPQWVTATADGLTATVAFSPPVSNGGATITKYTVSCVPACTSSSSPTSPIRVDGLIAGTAYTYTVTATNSAGTGIASATSNAAPACNGNPPYSGYIGDSKLEIYSYKEVGTLNYQCAPGVVCDGYHAAGLYTCSNLTGAVQWITVLTGPDHDNSLVNLYYSMKQTNKLLTFKYHNSIKPWGYWWVIGYW